MEINKAIIHIASVSVDDLYLTERQVYTLGILGFSMGAMTGYLLLYIYILKMVF